jgi:8-oxo-dGTP pyrophosphatase MutT (NUDIX family)
MPPGLKSKDDLYSLENTLAREVEEEARIKLTFEKKTPLLIMEEMQTGFIQVAFLGMTISAGQADHLLDNPRPVEGKPVKVHFDDLQDLLRHPDWVPTGKAAVLAWLALGAPGAGPYVRFGKYSANGLCEEILVTSHIEPAKVPAAHR